jgi:ribosomal protein L24E
MPKCDFCNEKIYNLSKEPTATLYTREAVILLWFCDKDCLQMYTDNFRKEDVEGCEI